MLHYFAFMEAIPISFDYNGRQYNGCFSEVHGAGSNVWHLMIDKYYYGRLMIIEIGWAFHGNTMQDMAEHFGEYITLWHE